MPEVPRYQAERYELEERTQGRKVVVRVGPFGGRRVVNVYKSKDAAVDVINTLNKYKNLEA